MCVSTTCGIASIFFFLQVILKSEIYTMAGTLVKGKDSFFPAYIPLQLFFGLMIV